METKNSPIGSRVIDDEKLNRRRCFRNFFGRKYLHRCIRSEIGSSVRARNRDGLRYRVVSAQDVEQWSRCPKIDGQVDEECRALSFAVRLEVLEAEIGFRTQLMLHLNNKELLTILPPWRLVRFLQIHRPNPEPPPL